MFASLPIGSAVMIQWEDGTPWTHGMVVKTADHNHHDWAYTIQLSTNGRRITCKRWHIKPTSVIVYTCLQYPTTKHLNTWTDPLEDILKAISNNPNGYGKVHTSRSNINTTQYCQQYKCMQQGGKEEHDQQSREVVNEDNRQKLEILQETK